MFGADAEADEVAGDRGQFAAFLALLRVCGDRGNGGDGFDAAEVRGAPDAGEAVEHGTGVGGAAFDLKTHQVAVAVCGLHIGGIVFRVHQEHVFLGQRVQNVVFQAEVIDFVHVLVSGEILGHTHRVL